MNKYEILIKMQNLCTTHGILFEINKHALIIRKYFVHRSNGYNYNQAIEFKVLTHSDFDLEDYVLKFEKELDEKLAELDKEESDKEESEEWWM